MVPEDGRNVRIYTIFSTVLAVLFALKILFSRIYRLPKVEVDVKRFAATYWGKS